MPFERQAPITVLYTQAQVGEYRADFPINRKILTEIKATSALIEEHQAQALRYLTATELRPTVLLGFSALSLQFKSIILEAL